MRITLADAKNSRLPSQIGACATDQRFLDLLNEAQERLLITGMWWGTVQKWRFCATDGCVALPSQFATLEAVAVCGRPISVRDQFYEFLENGFGIRGPTINTNTQGTVSPCCGGVSGTCGIQEALYRGHYPIFSDIIPTGKQLQLVCDKLTDVGKTVLCLGYDDNNNWIRTTQNGVVSDGEVVALAQGSGTLSVNNFSVVTDLQPPKPTFGQPGALDGQWWLYEYTTATAAQRLIGQYQYFDVRPSFARYFFPAIIPFTTSTGACTQVLVEALVKLEFIPVKNDTDYLIIGSLPALKEAMMALSKAEDEPDALRKVQIVSAGITVAKQILDQQLDHYLGSGRKMGMSVIGSSIGDVCPVPNLV